MASLSLRGIEKVYPNGFHAVKDFNLEIEDKEFIIFVGPSGCGKSTTLRMIAGLEDISGGVLEIDGKKMNDVEPKDRDIAMVFQNYALYPHMTVYDNMAFGLRSSLDDISDDAANGKIQFTPAQTALLDNFDQLNEEGQIKAMDYVEDLVLTGRYKKPATHGVATKEA